MMKLVSDVLRRIAESFRVRQPAFLAAFALALVIAVPIYLRSLWSNFIFDEQEALLANPYVNGQGSHVWEAFQRDFWGLKAERSIGSYRPIPNLIWRGLWQLREHPWPGHFFNLMIHALNAALLVSFAWRFSRDRAFAWLAGAAFLLAAVLTESICGVVGTADVLAGTAALCLLRVMQLRLGFIWVIAPVVALGLLCKESLLAVLPVLPWVGLVGARGSVTGGATGEGTAKQSRIATALAAGASAVAGLAGYTYFRRRLFLGETSESMRSALVGRESFPARVLEGFLTWFQQPRLPVDPINNPLAEAAWLERSAGALGVYWRGLTQVVWPWPLSGDYSFPQEPAPLPGQWLSVGTVLGAVFLLIPPLIGIFAALRFWQSQRRGHAAPLAVVEATEERRSPGYPWGVVALGAVWVPVTYLPHSNLLVLLPTVRAERFWYLPVIGTSLLLGLWLARLFRWSCVVGRDGRRARYARLGASLVGIGFLVSQALAARWHGLHYNHDLAFWRATANSSPLSAKAHLNYGVMLGARGDLETRVKETWRAVELAPNWPMGHVYLADTLCRLSKTQEAWPHYVRGFELGPNEQSLIALGLQCLWEKKQIAERQRELVKLADKHPGSWLAYLARDIISNGDKHEGVDKQYRPRGYDERAKKSE